MRKLEGKFAVITGGNSGMGKETARLFIAEGAKVIITGRREEELIAAAKELGENAFPVQGDVAKLSDLDRLFATVKERFGKLDILFANAGLGELAPLATASEAHFDNQFSVNVKGLFFTVQKALPLMHEGGSIILNSSIAAQLGMEAFSVYSATKAAVRSFARSWTRELSPRGIRVNVLSPGPIATPILNKMGLTETQVKEFGENIVKEVPLGRIGDSKEIATAVLFLASSDSSFVAGVDLSVDGGMAQV